MNTTVRGPEPDLVGWTKEQERNKNQSSGLGLGQHLPPASVFLGWRRGGPVSALRLFSISLHFSAKRSL